MTEIVDKIGSAESKGAERLTRLIDKLDEADSNSDGTIGMDEAASFAKADDVGSSTGAGGMPPHPPMS